jgi:crossover junction endodeoxyribonuclease RusA
MPSVEFVVSGMPVSSQAKDLALKAAYRRAVVEAAQVAMGTLEPFATPVLIFLAIFGEGGVRPDGDNVAKLVQDALQGIVYVNDRQIDDTIIRRRGVEEPIIVAGTPELLACTLARGASFMYVEVTTDVNRAVIAWR